MGVASGCGEQEAGVASGSGWNLWAWLLGVVVRRYRFPHTTYPYSSCICSFLQQYPYFLFIFKMFFISRDEPDSPLTQYMEYLALGTLSRILNTTILLYG